MKRVWRIVIIVLILLIAAGIFIWFNFYSGSAVSGAVTADSGSGEDYWAGLTAFGKRFVV